MRIVAHEDIDSVGNLLLLLISAEANETRESCKSAIVFSITSAKSATAMSWLLKSNTCITGR